VSWEDNIQPRKTTTSKRDGKNNQREAGSMGDHLSALRRFMKAVDRVGETDGVQYTESQAKAVSEIVDRLAALVDGMRNRPKGSTIMVNMTDETVNKALRKASAIKKSLRAKS
tara:strand:- start:157 stop:495 length:339 start_codon:yes stop_codon:yes gene_type:complete